MLTSLGITTEPDEHIDDKPDHSWSDDPICPYCLVAATDAWEMDFGAGLDGDTQHMCGACGKEFFVTRICIVRYETRPIDA